MKRYKTHFFHHTSFLFYFSDSIAIVLSGIITLYGWRPASHISSVHYIAIFLTLFIALSLYSLLALYKQNWAAELTCKINALIFAWSIVLISLMSIFFFLKISNQFSRIWMGTWYLLGLVSLIISRVLIYLVHNVINKKLHPISVGIVGIGHMAYKAFDTIESTKWSRLKIYGFYQSPEKQVKHDKISHEKILGDLKTLVEHATNDKIQQIWIALPLNHVAEIPNIITLLDTTYVDILWIPDLFQIPLLNHSITHFRDLPIVNLCVTPMHGSRRIIKALEDKIFSLVLLVFFSPIMLLVSLIIKCTSPGPIFYKQIRISWNGHRFNIFKFRSMPVNTGKNNQNITWGNVQKKPKTAIGDFLRKTSLDELPQLINVLRGDMSLVGPRPERDIFVDQLKYKIPGYMKKHKVKAGITGWAQIHGLRGDTSLKERIKYDLYYIEHWSLWLDIKIIWLTIFKGMRHKNAY